MTAPRENLIRDQLATRLDLIEPGLELLATEYVVGNPDGAGGRIDILARDRLGNIVVIELKRSDQAARTALHELMKYIALVQVQRGLTAERLRAVLVSTEWHELLTPFSEQVHTSRYSLQGYALTLDASGAPCRADPIVPLPASNGLVFPTKFSWLTFSSASDRQHAHARIEEILRAVAVEHATLIEFDSIELGRVQFPYSLVLAIFPMSGAQARGILEQKTHPIELLSDFGALEELREDDHTLQAAVQASLESVIFCVAGVRDVHTVQSRNLLAERKLWQLERVTRLGPRLEDRLLLSDADLVEALCGIDGSNEVYLLKAVASSSKAQFEALAAALDRLLSRHGWATAAVATLKRAALTSGATIVARAHTPSNLLTNFAVFLRTGDSAYLPSFDIIASAASRTESLSGLLAWDGVTEPPSPDAAFPDLGTGGNVMRLVFEDPDETRRLVSAYGLVFPWLRRIDDGETERSQDFVSIEAWLSSYPERAAELSLRLGPIRA